MTEFKTEAEAMAALTAKPELTTVEVNGRQIPHLLLPPGHTAESFDKYLPTPHRIKARPGFFNIDSFARYFHEYDNNSVIFADDRDYSFTTVFDANKPASDDGVLEAIPGWEEHRSMLRFEFSHEWDRWYQNSGKRMKPRQFIEFLEDNCDYVVGDFNAGRLLEMCRDLRATITGHMEVDEDGGNGPRELVIKKNGSVTGAGIRFPEVIKVRLRVFRNASAFDFTARLRWSQDDREGVQFYYAINDVEGVKEEAFDILVKAVEEACGRQVLKGVYDRNARSYSRD